MKPKSDIVLSVLDLASVREGGTVAESFRNTLTLAQHAEKWGYRRFWLAEHHNLVGIASAATSVLIGHVAGSTKTIRVGSGGIMLPSPFSRPRPLPAWMKFGMPVKSGRLMDGWLPQ